MAPPGYLQVGRLVKTHGVRGEIRVALFADRWEPFQDLKESWVGPSGGPFRAMAVESSRKQDRGVILKFRGVDSREAAARLVGQEVAIPRSAAPPPASGSFYHYDLLGLEVVGAGRTLGRVREILETPAHDVFVVDGAEGEWMLPATRTHIRRIDLAAGRIELDPVVDVMEFSTVEARKEERR